MVHWGGSRAIVPDTGALASLLDAAVGRTLRRGAGKWMGSAASSSRGSSDTWILSYICAMIGLLVFLVSFGLRRRFHPVTSGAWVEKGN